MGFPQLQVHVISAHSQVFSLHVNGKPFNKRATLKHYRSLPFIVKKCRYIFIDIQTLFVHISHYKHFQRFLRHFRLNWPQGCTSSLISGLSDLSSQTPVSHMTDGDDRDGCTIVKWTVGFTPSGAACVRAK